MKTKLLTLAAASVFLVSHISAISLRDTNFRDVNLLMDSDQDGISETVANKSGMQGYGVVMNPTYSFITGRFNLVDDGVADGKDSDGFNPDLWTIQEAIVGFIFVASDSAGKLEINRANFELGELFNVGNVSEEPSIDGEGKEVPTTASDVFEIQFDSSIYTSMRAQVILDIQDDGLLDWEIRMDDNATGSMWLYSNFLGVVATPNPVPDVASTFGLFGISLFGLACFARKRRS